MGEQLGIAPTDEEVGEIEKSAEAGNITECDFDGFLSVVEQKVRALRAEEEEDDDDKEPTPPPSPPQTKSKPSGQARPAARRQAPDAKPTQPPPQQPRTRRDNRRAD